MNRTVRSSLPVLLVLGAALPAQILMVNTRQAGFLPLSSTSWVAGNWGYRNANGRFCLQTRSGQGLAVIDVTDPRNPVLASNVPGNVKEVKVYGNYAYASTDSGPSHIVNLTNPYAAVTVGTMSQGTHTIGVDGNRLYFNRSVSSATGMRIYSLANPANPQLLGDWNGYAHDSAPYGNICYVFGFVTPRGKILDVSNPASIVQLGTFTTGNHSGDLYVAPNGQKYLLTCDEQTGGIVYVWNVTNPASPTQIGSYSTPAGASISVHNVRIKGVYAYVAWYKDGLRILDLQNPAQPVEVGVFDTNPTNSGGTYSDTWDPYPYHDAVYIDIMTNQLGYQGAFFVDFYPGFGSGSPGTAGRVPAPWWSFGPPSPGNADFALRLEDARPNSVAYLVLGLSKTTWNGIPLPHNLGPTAPDVNINVSIDAIIPVTTDSQGKAAFALPVPQIPRGPKFYCQWFVLDPGAPNPLGLAVSKGGDLIVE